MVSHKKVTTILKAWGLEQETVSDIYYEGTGNKNESAVYVGDTEGDENAAHAAGIPFIHAAYGFGAAQNPEGTIWNLSDLINKN